MPFEIIQLPAFHLVGNYLYILRWEDGTPEGITAAVDPGDATVIAKALDERGWGLDYILNTHYHWDHTDGNLPLKEMYSCQIIGPAYPAKTPGKGIRGIDQQVTEGDALSIGGSEIKIVFIPGHTNDHIAFYFDTEKVVFSGDVLFSLGCGKMFEGDAATYWDSMQKLRALPGDTQVYATHEYTLGNARFAKTIMANTPGFQDYCKRAKELRRKDKPTIPVKLADEVAFNPFLRCDQPEVLTHYNTNDPVEAFRMLRADKDGFHG